VARLVLEQCPALGVRFWIEGRQRRLAPVDAMHLGLRHVPGVMRIGKAHPAEPGIVGRQAAEPVEGAIGNPVRVIELARHVHGPDLYGTRVARAHGVLPLLAHHRIEARLHLGVRFHEAVVVAVALEEVIREFHVVETAMGPRAAFGRHAVLEVVRGRPEPGFEVRLADEPRAIAVLAQPVGDGRLLLGQGHAVHPHSVRAHLLPRDDRRPRRHADDMLIVRPRVVDAARGETVDDRGTRHLAAVAAERIEAHLVRGDEQDVALHGRSSNSAAARPGSQQHGRAGR